MAYSTKALIIKKIGETRLVQLSSDGNSGAVNDDNVTEAIARADATIKSFIEPRYKTVMPFSSTPELIEGFSVILSITHLYARKQGVPDSWKEERKEVMNQLKLIAKGTMAISGIDMIAETQLKQDTVDFTASNPGRKYAYDVENDRDQMTGFQ